MKKKKRYVRISNNGKDGLGPTKSPQPPPPPKYECRECGDMYAELSPKVIPIVCERCMEVRAQILKHKEEEFLKRAAGQ